MIAQSIDIFILISQFEHLEWNSIQMLQKSKIFSLLIDPNS
jgi:hypothetical protein